VFHLSGEFLVVIVGRYDITSIVGEVSAAQQAPHHTVNKRVPLLQEWTFRCRLPQDRHLPSTLNQVTTPAFVGLVGGLLVVGLDLIGVIDPFQLFSFNFTWAIALFSVVVLVASLFVYRPWCRVLCPFGLVGWLVEQVRLMRPRIKRDACKQCKLCVKACPSGAMADFYADAKLHADCFACGACIAACPQKEALGWWTKKALKK